MNTFGKIFFWICVIILGFVSPVISFALIVLYYLLNIVQEICQTCKEACDDTVEYTEYTYRETRKYRPDQPPPKMDSFSEDTLKDMK